MAAEETVMQADDDQSEAGRYGIWPMIGGVAFAGGLIWFMFALADGFA